jgi:hypothetical protein
MHLDEQVDVGHDERKGVQLAEKGLESWQKRAWVDLEELPA